MLALACIPSAFAQTYPAHLLDAPFTANWSQTTTHNATTSTQSGVIARASNGSTYMTFSDSHFPGPGGIYRIEIDDLPNNRHITLHPGRSSNSYYLGPLGNARTFTLQSNARMLQQLQDSYLQRPDRTKPDGQAHETALGVKQQEGLTLFGHRSEFTSTKGETRTDEMWDSDLGVVVTLKDVVPAEAKESVFSVTDIRRVEPDQKLFEIPEGYRANGATTTKPIN